MKTFKVIFIFFLTSHIVAQINIHKNITTEDGLVNGQVSAIMQDSKGYIWFGTYDGVSRWDGINFKNIQTHNGMLTSAILDIKEGPDGKIYFANYQGGIIVYDEGSLDTINESNGLISNVITSIVILQNKNILFCASGNEITQLKNGKLTNWSKEVNFPNDKLYNVRDVYQEKNGDLYFATQNGLVIYKNNTFKIITKADGLNSDYIFGVAGNGKGVIYLSTYRGINKIENGVISNLTLNTRFQDSFCNKIIIAEDGTMYAAAAHGIVSEKNGILKAFTEENGLAYNHCFSLLQDSNGSIYFGTNGRGVNIYDPTEKIISYNKLTGLPSESIWSILKSKEGTVYLGSVDGLIIQNKRGTKLVSKRNGLSGNFVRVIKESKDGSLLVGTANGFNILKNNNIKNYKLKNDRNISQVYSIFETDNGNIYLGTQSGVIVFRDGEELKKESTFITEGIIKGLKAEMVYTIAQSKSGMLLFGGLNGLTTYENGKFNYFTTQNGLVDNTANTIHVSSDGSIIVGTLKGLNILRNGRVIDTIDVKDGLSNNSIADIEEDDMGRLYVATYKGLNILQNYKSDSLTITGIYKKDGLIGDDFTHEGTFFDSEGSLWLGTLNGISKYNTNVDKHTTTPPQLYLTGLQLYNKDFPLTEFLENPKLSYDENFLNFIYTGINLSAPEKIKYKYRLTGVDKNWVETTGNTAPYTNLDDGNYTFEAKARNEWGYWSESVQLSFTINPAWWETWWFYTLAIISLAGLIAFVASYRYRNLLAIEKVRTKISSDLHDNIGSGLTDINFLSETVKSQTKGNANVAEGLNNISDISKTLINDMRDIVWLVNPSKDTLKDLFNRLQDSYQEVLRFSNISLKVNGLQNLAKIKLPMNYRQHIYLMFKEAINNSINYSNCKNINLDVSTEASTLIVKMEDDGKGFDFENIKFGNGIKNIKDRAKQVKGNVSIESEINEGTKIKFTGKFSKLQII